MTKKDSRGGQNAKVKSNPFNMQNADTHYWLGMLASDGCVSNLKSNISLISKDFNHLMKYVNYTGCHIHKYKNRDCYTAYFGNYETKQFLIDLGITPKKSLTFEYKGKFNRHFIRGVFDGDGNPGTFSKKNTCLMPKITTGSKKFRDQLIDHFISLGFKCNYYKKGNCYDVYIRGDSRLDFYFYLYKNQKLFLSRKQQVYWTLLEKSKGKAFGEFRENPSKFEELWDNPELSLVGDNLESATTKAESLVDNNCHTSAGLLTI